MNEMKLRECVEKLETPFYVYDKDIFRNTIKRMQMNLTPEVKLCYAMKANPFMAGFAEKYVDRIEVCSFGESRIVKALGISPKKLLISGVLKKEEDLLEIIKDFGAEAAYTAESMAQFELIDQLAQKEKLKLNVLLRLTDGSQFGMEQSEIEKILSEEHPGAQVTGIHYFSGTQKKNPGIIREELAMLADFLDQENSEYGHQLTCLEYGPGFKVDYFKDTSDFILKQNEWDDLNKLLQEISKRYIVTLEMGRAIAAECGFYVTKVQETKKNHNMNYAIVDGGIHQLNYDGQIRGMYMPKVKILHDLKKKSKEDAKKGKNAAKTKEKWTVAGSLCTKNDILLNAQEMNPLTKGDFLVFEKAGAYSGLEGMSLFLSHELPGIYSYSRYDGIQVLRERQESYLLNMDVCQGDGSSDTFFQAGTE